MPEMEDNPPTLASLRLRGQTKRARAKTAVPIREQTGMSADTQQAGALDRPQMGLFFSADSAASVGVDSLSGAGPRSRSVREAVAPKTILVEASQDAALAAVQQPTIWSVRDLVGRIRQQLESGYADLWVEGEVSNCRPAPSGHLYFTLKDGEAQLPVVLFRRQAILLRFKPADGLAVLVRGRVSVYESRGQLQLIAETMEPRGAGALQLAFEQLKARLLAEGLFDAARKRTLPAFPKCVGVITSPTGAVIRDIVTVCRRRHARLSLLVYPATMQGANCASSVIAGLRWFHDNPGQVDVIVIARGGGSMEDLAGFNDEALARAIAASELPVVSAIGHETDFTIADFVADLRAPTPSAAAELVTAGQHRIEERVAALERRIQRAGRYQLMQARQRYTRLSTESVLRRLGDAVSRRDQRLDELRLRMEAAIARRFRMPEQRLVGLTHRLRRQDVSLQLAAARHRLQQARLQLERVSTQRIAREQSRLGQSLARLETLSPLAVLGRGYALAYGADGRLLHSSQDTAPGQAIRIRLARGAIGATVTEIEVAGRTGKT